MMPQARPILARIFMFAMGRRFRSLSSGIVMAMCAGLLFPAIIGGVVLTSLRQELMSKEVSANIDDKMTLLTKSLVDPVWNFDKEMLRTISDATLIDPQVVRIAILDQDQTSLLGIERPERRIGMSRVARSELVRGGVLLGFVELEMDDGLRRRELEQDHRAYVQVLLGQFVLALVLLLIAIRLRVLNPLTRLTAFSDQIANGNLEQSINWTQPDEIGQLARQLDQMRGNLLASFSEQQAILNNIRVGVLFVRERRILVANRHAELIFGYSTGEMQGLPISVLFFADANYVEVSRLGDEAITTGVAWFEKELQMKRQDGSTFSALLHASSLDRTSPQAGNIWVIDDITERKQAEEKINHLAFFDQLTGLPNRVLLQDRLKQAMASSQRSGSYGALLLIDLDYFKTLNDTLGHDKGDLLLIQVALRLTQCVRKEDTVARLGGDEFVVVLASLSESQSEAASRIELVCEKIIAALNTPYDLKETSYSITSSIGASLFLGQQTEIDTLLKQADLAMYKAKDVGRNSLLFFDPDMAREVLKRVSLQNELREAVQKQQFVLHYQVQLAGSQMTGVEVLLRWQHPERGLVSPGEFIPVMEETGLIFSVGQWVLKTACQQLAEWARQPDMSHFTVAVNISAHQLNHENFVDQVLKALELSGAPPQRLKLELTESSLVNNVEDTIGKMTALKAKGVGFLLDDFGTGYSSLSYLKRLPLDQLKIDQSFIRDILIDPNDAAIAKMIVILAESLGLGVIAEGVETEAQRNYLTQLGCHAYQGYLFSRPLPLHEFETFVKQVSASIGTEPGRG
ncbi:MAG: diguanylate cyclase/phosphodiesterase with sensor(s) [Burkholderiaceae bacterium]|nr:diguanylate cyclase/phosphodiesterase with sensor(s) [Burkholderiaceae bacterium]